MKTKLFEIKCFHYLIDSFDEEIPASEIEACLNEGVKSYYTPMSERKFYVKKIKTERSNNVKKRKK